MVFYFVTGNENKLKEVRRLLGMEVNSVSLEIDEIQSLYTKEIIIDRAKKAYEKVKQPVIVEDVGFYIKSWNDFPGAFIKYWNGSIGAKYFCEFIKNFDDKTAIAQAGLCFYDGKEFHTFFGDVKGVIVDSPRGDSTFGFDPVFQPDGFDKTFAEMTVEEKNSCSHRAIAFNNFKKWLDDNGNV